MDAGTGIDPATVEMRLNGEVVAADYITGTGQLLYLPEEPPAGGTYSVTVSAADVVGNGGSASATFTVEATYRVYLRSSCGRIGEQGEGRCPDWGGTGGSRSSRRLEPTAPSWRLAGRSLPVTVSISEVGMPGSGGGCTPGR